MKIYKSLRVPAMLIFGVLALAICIVPIKNILIKAHKEPMVTTINKSYAAEVRDPKWALKTADLVVVGDIVNKGNAVKGNNSSAQEVVYTDNNVKVTQVIKDNSGKGIKPGDTICVRILGGATDTLDYQVDTDNLLANSKSTLLCLVDGAKEPMLPRAVDKQYFSIVGGIHGAFDLTTDGLAVRSKTKESFKLNDLLKLVQ